MKNNDDKISERQAKQTEVDAVFDAVLPEYGHVDEVGGSGNQETEPQEVRVNELLELLVSFLGNQSFRVVQ